VSPGDGGFVPKEIAAELRGGPGVESPSPSSAHRLLTDGNAQGF